jgi:RNA polymerase sigma-70 factor (ECF subfamily)
MQNRDRHALSDTELLDAIVARDTTAISELYDRFSRSLYGTIFSVVKDAGDAEDLLQEVFVQIWNKASTYRSELSSPKVWLMRMAHNKAIDLLRSRRHRQRRSEISSTDYELEALLPEHVGNTTWNQTLQGERAVILECALGRLPGEQRYLIDLAFFQGYTHNEIAELTNVPLGTVKTRIRSGIQVLRSCLHFMAEDMN